MEKEVNFDQNKLHEPLRAFLNAPRIPKTIVDHPLMLTTFTKLSVERPTSGTEHVRRRGIVELLLALQVTRTC